MARLASAAPHPAFDIPGVYRLRVSNRTVASAKAIQRLTLGAFV
jgi:hypothetical protein